MRSDHGMPGSRCGCWAHVLEHIPPLICLHISFGIHLLDKPELTGDPEGRKIAKVLPADVSSSKYIDDIVYNRCSVALPRHRYVANTREFGPCAGGDVERPRIVVMIIAIGPAESANNSACSYAKISRCTDRYSFPELDTRMCPVRRGGAGELYRICSH